MTTSDMIRSWMGSGVDAAKDMLPWIMLLMTRGKAGPQSAIMKSIFKR